MTDDGSAPTIPDTGVPLHRDPSSTKTPDPRYVLRRVLGEGGMGEVWLAHDTRVDRDIAIKLMRGGTDDPELVARFLREARVQGRLEHPSVVPVHDVSDAGSTPFFAMKRLAGMTLADVLAHRDDHKWPLRTLLARFVDVCLAVELAHQRGVIHRDLKPSNIMLGDFGEAYVLDWGVARLAGDSEVGSAIAPTTGGSALTEAGALLGTPGYMAPEQLHGQTVDARSDVYALGCILFEILTRTPANPRSSAIAHTLTADEHRPSARGHEVAPELDTICARATVAAHADRLASAREVADLVQRYLDGDRDHARRRELAAAHVVTAQRLAAGREDERVAAIQEAGRAIALDVENVDAQQILARLLLEPPTTIPPGAQRAIAHERRVAEIEVLRSAILGYTAFLLGLPITWLLGISETWPLVVFGVGVMLTGGLCVVARYRAAPVSFPLAVAILVAHCATLATVGLLLGPLLLVPVLIFGSATIMFVQSAVRAPKLIATAHLLALAVPLALELGGVTPSTFAVEAGALVLRPWAFEMSPLALVAAVVGTCVLQLAGNMVVLDRHRGAQMRAEERIHLQAWRLQQLVPSSGSTP